mgnify:CR=1 FL=1
MLHHQEIVHLTPYLELIMLFCKFYYYCLTEIKQQKKIKRLRLEECVELVGWKTPAQVRELLGNSDIYCFSGKVAASGDRDGFPNVIAEAFMAGVAVIAHKVADVGSGVGSGKTGVLLESLEQGLWVAAIKELLSDEETRAEYVHNARSWVEENFSARKNSERFLKFVFGGKL